MVSELAEKFEGFDDDSLIVLVCDDFLYFHYSLELVKALTKDLDMRGAVVLMNYDTRVISEQLRQKGVDESKLWYIDCVSLIAGLGHPDMGNCITIRHPSEVENILMSIDHGLRQFSGQKFVVFFSPHIFLEYLDVNNTGMFFYEAREFLKKKHCLDVFMCNKDHDQAIIDMLDNLADITVRT